MQSIRILSLFTLLLAVSCSSCKAFVTPTSTLSQTTQPLKKAYATTNSPIVLLARNDDDDEDIRQNFYQREQRSSNNVMSNLLTFQGAGSAIVAAGWAFVIIGLILPMFGYDYVVKDGRVTIDTVEARQFQNEINRATTGTKKSLPQVQNPLSNIADN